MSTREIHWSYDLRAAMRLSDADLVAFFVKDDGTKPTPDEMRRAIMLAWNKGYEVLPLPDCDARDERGHCRGHVPADVREYPEVGR